MLHLQKQCVRRLSSSRALSTLGLGLPIPLEIKKACTTYCVTNGSGCNATGRLRGRPSCQHADGVRKPPFVTTNGSNWYTLTLGRTLSVYAFSNNMPTDKQRTVVPYASSQTIYIRIYVEGSSQVNPYERLATGCNPQRILCLSTDSHQKLTILESFRVKEGGPGQQPHSPYAHLSSSRRLFAAQPRPGRK